MRKLFSIALLFLISQVSFGQDKKIDKLEILYDQGYFAKVLRKSNKLLANPEMDYSGLPSFYKSLSLFRMAGEAYWFKKHRSSIDEAISSYKDFLDNENSGEYIYAHYYEIASLKTYLDNLEDVFRQKGFNGSADKLNAFANNELKGIKSKPDDVYESDGHETVEISSMRQEIVVYGKSFIGVKYVWSGSDSKGFDCSGFTSFVLKNYGIYIPRTASGQMENSKKKKISNAEMGDLVFFGKGTNITHVGLVVSAKGEELKMVHASTSKGVIVTNIEQSTYWKPKLKGVGTYL